MGGEIATQDLIDRLQEVFQPNRIVHVYASTEHGSLFSVSDGKAGFPVEWLNQRPSSGIGLRLLENELYISRGPGHDYLPTGDAVRIENRRVLFAGRTTEQINVGGRKVNPVQIEASLRSIAGVIDVRVYAVPNAITGEVVAADLVLEPGSKEEETLQVIHAYCRDHLAAFERPRKIQFVKGIPTTKAGKTVGR
jgi:acyl-coenzyme A synthetase/AMP-(fatty) acid ligase